MIKFLKTLSIIVLLLIIFFVTLFVFSGGSDELKKLPNGYTYISESNLGKEIIYENAKSINEQENNSIPCTIKKYKYNQNFIILKQNYYHDGSICTQLFPDLQQGKSYYWILDTQNKIRYGPYEKNTNFRLQKNKLNINLSLE